MNAALGIFWHRKSGLKESQVGFGGGYLVSVCVCGGGVTRGATGEGRGVLMGGWKRCGRRRRCSS